MDNTSVLNYFRLKETGKYFCLLPSCPRNNKPISTSSTNKVGNLRRHLQLCHSDTYTNFLSENEITGQAITKLKILQYCVEAVTVNGRPLALLEDSGIVGLIGLITESNGPGPKVKVNLSVIQQQIRKMASLVRAKITTELKGRILSVMVDMVTRNHSGLLSVNAQYYSKGKIVLRQIGLLEIHERHTCGMLKNMVRDNLKSYDVSFDRIYAFTTVSASSMIERAKLLDLDTFNEISFSDAEGDIDDNALCVHFNNLNKSLREEFRRENNAIQLQHVTGVGCAANSLQVAVREGLTVSKTGFFIAKCRQLAKTLCTSKYLLEFKNLGAKLPLVDNESLWNSTYLMV